MGPASWRLPCPHAFVFLLSSPSHRYEPTTVLNVQIAEGKATQLNFTLALAAGSTASPLETSPGINPSSSSSSSTAGPSGSAQTQVLPSAPPEREPIQPQDFRHHSHADMEVFLRKYRSDFPSITHLYSVGRSVQGRELYVMVVSDKPREHEQGQLLALSPEGSCV